MVKILHLSDLHLAPQSLADYGFVQKALVTDIAQIVAEGEFAPDIMIFSGDLVLGGGIKDAFALADANFLQPTLIAAGLDATKLFMVPGNHDVNRDVVRRDKVVEAGQRAALTNRDALNEFIDDNQDNPNDGLFRRLKEYRRFCEAIPSPHLIRSTAFFSTYRLQIGAVDVGIAAYNTSWRASGEEGIDYGKMLLGERAITNAIADIEACQMKIAVLHHPMSWLADFDRYDCSRLLLHNFDIVLTGHMHSQSPEMHQSPIGKAVLSEGGALYASRKYHNGYCLIDIGPEKPNAEFLLRRYEDNRWTFVNATNVAPQGRYSVSLRGDDDVKKTSSLDDILSHVRSQVLDAANEHMISAHAETKAPKQFRDIYIELPIKTRSQFRSATGQDADPQSGRLVTDAEILRADKPVVIYGGRETGKTSLAYHIAMELCTGTPSRLRIPVYIDFSMLQVGESYIQRQIRSFIGKRGSEFDLNSLLKDGAFFLIFDNFDLGRADPDKRIRRKAMVDKFYLEFPANGYLFLQDELTENSLHLTVLEKMGFEHEAFYIHNLGHKNVRELTKRWLEPSGLFTRASLRAVERKLEVTNLPRTAYVISLVLWTLEKESSVGAVNEASLLQRFIEAILNRSNLADVERGSLDFVIKEAFLSQIGYEMYRSGINYIAKNALVQRAITFCSDRSWEVDVPAFINLLERTGILVTSLDESGALVTAFRYRCLREYFTARYLMSDTAAYQRVFDEDEFVELSREIDILTGLGRNDPVLLRRLVSEVTDFLACDFVSRLTVPPSRLKLSGFTPQNVSASMLEEIRTGPRTDDEIEAAIDANSGPLLEPSAGSEFSERHPKGGNDNVLVRGLHNVMLLSKVVRNSELVSDATLKSDAVDRSIAGWAFFAGLGHFLYDAQVDKRGKDSSELTSEEITLMSSQERILKITFPVIIDFIVYAYLGTSLLKGVYLNRFKETETGRVIERFFLTQTIANLYFIDGVGDLNEVKSLIYTFIDEASGNPLVLFTLYEKMFILYYRPNLGSSARLAIENIMADLLLKMQGGVASGVMGGARKGLILKALRALASRRTEVDDI